MQRARFWIICAICAILVISGLVLASTRYWKINKEALKNMLPADVSMRLDGLNLSQAGAEDRNMRISATSAQHFNNQNLFVLNDVVAHIFSAQGNYVISAENGRYSPGTRRIELDGRVRTVDELGRILESDQMTFNVEDGLLSSPGAFCLSSADMDLAGSAFIFRTGENRLDVAGRVHMNFNQE